MIELKPKEFQTLIVKHSEDYVKTGRLMGTKGLQRSVTVRGILYIENTIKERN